MVVLLVQFQLSADALLIGAEVNAAEMCGSQTQGLRNNRADAVVAPGCLRAKACASRNDRRETNARSVAPTLKHRSRQ
jgi:hypothetical protein